MAAGTSAFYQVNIAWVRALLWAVSSRDVRGLENVPRKGPLILASNHLNNADPPVLGATTPREISWLTKAEWFKTPLIGWMFKMGGMIPVRRFEADLGALREAQEMLQAGGCLGMFPEGTRSKTAELQRGEPGSALIALRTGAPVQPVALWGTEKVRLPRDLAGSHAGACAVREAVHAGAPEAHHAGGGRGGDGPDHAGDRSAFAGEVSWGVWERSERTGKGSRGVVKPE